MAEKLLKVPESQIPEMKRLLRRAGRQATGVEPIGVEDTDAGIVIRIDESRLLPGGVGEDPEVINYDVVEFTNGVGQTILQGGVVGFSQTSHAGVGPDSPGGPAVDPIVLLGVRPTEAEHRGTGRWGVVIEDTPAGQRGRAVVSGVVVVRLIEGPNNDNIGGQFLDFKDQSISRLKFFKEGSAILLSGEIGEKAVVRIGLPAQEGGGFTFPDSTEQYQVWTSNHATDRGAFAWDWVRFH